MEKISPADLVPMDIFIGNEPIKIDLVYANENHARNIFDEALYHDSARLWAHRDIAAITLLTARVLNRAHGYTVEIQDCLRTTEAQKAMGETKIVQANPEWLQEPNRMVSPPGHGAHPRGMAIDVGMLDKDDNPVDMGTLFDDMDKKSYRSYDGFPEEILQNRLALENAFMKSAKLLGHDFLPLPSEWWDYRFPAETYRKYGALSDENLPPQMQMTHKIDNGIPDFNDEHFQKLGKEIKSLIDKNDADL